jgi:hypothetical protein
VPRLPEISNSSSSDTYTGPLVSDDCDCWTYVGPPSSMRTKGWQVGAMARYREAPPVMRVYENASDSTEFCLHLKRDNDHLEGVALPLLVLFVRANAAPSLFKCTAVLTPYATNGPSWREQFTLRRVVPSSPPCLLWPPPSPTSHCLVFDALLRPPWPGNKPASDPEAESERAERLFTWLHAYELS